MPPRGGIAEYHGTCLQQAVSSHAPARGHRKSALKQRNATKVSSHAPVRGHRRYRCICLCRICFKSCPREGASCNACCCSASITFQVMPPRGGIQFCKSLFLWLICFKSCPREGASISSRPVIMPPLFQVMPPRGGISCAANTSNIVFYGFKSCPREGASYWCKSACRPYQGFKSCPREGASEPAISHFSHSSKFQVMPP